jgi:hypothetical protein
VFIYIFIINGWLNQQQIPILVFGLTRPGLEPTIYRTRDEHANYYTTDVVKSSINNKDINKHERLCNISLRHTKIKVKEQRYQYLLFIQYIFFQEIVRAFFFL